MSGPCFSKSGRLYRPCTKSISSTTKILVHLRAGIKQDIKPLCRDLGALEYDSFVKLDGLVHALHTGDFSPGLHANDFQCFV